jgi:hypothetical protein
MTDAPHICYPVFLFSRVSEASGTLYHNIFGRRRPSRRQWIEINEAIAHLQSEFRAGRLDEVVIGWPGDGRTPLNAADT